MNYGDCLNEQNTKKKLEIRLGMVQKWCSKESETYIILIYVIM